MAAVRRAITGFLLCGAFFLSASAWAAADAGPLNPSEGWRFALGYTYLSQARDLKDSIKRLSREHGEGGDIYNLSLNLSFQPYYQFKNGWRAGAGIGPFLIFYGDSRHLQIPVHLTLGYSFFKDAKFSVYCRAGISWHGAWGDYIATSRPGGHAALGVECFNTRSAHIGLEAAWDGAEISLDARPGRTDHEKIQAGALTLFLYADF